MVIYNFNKVTVSQQNLILPEVTSTFNFIFKYYLFQEILTIHVLNIPFQIYVP